MVSVTLWTASPIGENEWDQIEQAFGASIPSDIRSEFPSSNAPAAAWSAAVPVLAEVNRARPSVGPISGRACRPVTSAPANVARHGGTARRGGMGAQLGAGQSQRRPRPGSRPGRDSAL